jgi:protein-tyrosine phosphatase
MIDLHCHILPGIDDGADSLADSIAMCRMAAADGCRAMIATPHQRRPEWWNGDREGLVALAEAVQEAVGPQLRVLTGAEVHVDSDLLGEVEKLPGGSLLTLAGSRYLLIELPFVPRVAQDEAAADLVYELGLQGFRPILAHPELIPWLAGDTALIERLVRLGATVQVTAMSVTGEFGKQPQHDAMALLDAGLVHFVASDSHDTFRRPPGLRRAYERIAERLS